MTHFNEYFALAKNAKIYIGSNLCGTMPAIVTKSTLYSFDCDLNGDNVKIESSTLLFANVEVYSRLPGETFATEYTQ